MNDHEVVEALREIRDKTTSEGVRGVIAVLMVAILENRVDHLCKYLVPYTRDAIRRLSARNN